MLALTHHNSHDVPAIGTMVYQATGRPIHFAGAEELLPKTPKNMLEKVLSYTNYELENEFSFLSKKLLEAGHGLPINRDGHPGPSQIAGIFRVLRAGGIVGMAPEAGRYDGDEVAEGEDFKPGVGRLALKAEAPVVVAAIAGQNWRRKSGNKAGEARWYLPRSAHVHIGHRISKRELSDLKKYGSEGATDSYLRALMQLALREAYRQYEHINGAKAAARLDRSTEA